MNFVQDVSMKRTYTTPLSPLQRKKILRLALLLLFVLFLALFLTPGKGLYFLRKQKKEVSEISAEKLELTIKNDELREDIQKLQTDMNYLEEVARKQHGMLKKDEKVFDFSSREEKKSK
jgi:cell division protein FtsB